MWEKLYEYMNFLNRKIEKYPNETHFTVEMDLDLYKFASEVHFVSNDGYINFKGKIFCLG